MANLAVLAVLHPLRVYLGSQNLTVPITACSLFLVLLHGPIRNLMIVASLLANPRVTMASMGILLQATSLVYLPYPRWARVRPRASATS